MSSSVEATVLMSVREKIKGWLSENRDPSSISSDVFAAIDVDYVQKKYSPQKQGYDDGLSNLPHHQSSRLSSCEMGLKGEFEGYQQLYVNSYNRAQSTYLARAESLVQSLDLQSIRNEEEERNNDVIAHALREVARLDSRKVTLVGRAVQFLNFRQEHSLMHRLPDVGNIWRSLSILLGFYVFELLVTFFLTREAGSALTVLLIALVYCTLNCGFPFFFACFCRPIFYGWDRGARKLAGGILTCSYFVTGVVMNLMMGHYRGVTMENARAGVNSDPRDFAQATEIMNRMLGAGVETIDRLTTTPLSLGEPQAYMLAGFGLLCFLVSWLDGLVKDDKYPNYGHQQYSFDSAYQDYADELDDVTERLLEAQRVNVGHIKSLKKELVAKIESLPLIVQLSNDLNLECRNALATLDTRFQQLIIEYRMANQMARKEDPPSYFDEQVRLPEPFLNIPSFPAFDESMKSRLEATLEGFAQELHGQYSKHINKLQSAPSVLDKASGLDRHPMTVEASYGSKA